MSSIQEKYQQFRRWQQQPFEYHDTADRHTCSNCGNEYDSNYCPRCGQKAAHGPITWKSVWGSVMDVWGVGTRSLPYSLWQLLWRPGYLIRDYISGKRQVSFPPVKMMVIVAFFALMIIGLIDPEMAGNDDVTNVSATGYEHYVDLISNWLDNHPEWAFLSLFSLLILPVYYLFRHAPKFPRHSLPQGFFIQVFTCTQFILLMTIVAVVIAGLNPFILEEEDEDVSGIMVPLVLLILLFDYKQLFGYGWWGTLWRVLLSLPLGLLFLKVIAQFVRFLKNLFMDGLGHETVSNLAGTIDKAALCWLVMELFMVINRKEWRKRGLRHVMKRPLLAVLAFAVTSLVCYLLGCDGAITGLINSFIMLEEL